jgi:hypothetical protein
MSESHRESHPESQPTSSEIRYPTNTVLGVIDTREQLEHAVETLTSGGFLADEVTVATGVATADAVHDTTGRSGLAKIAVRIAEKLGIQDDEMEFKSQYEQAMRDGRFVVLISAPTDARRDRAIEVLRQHGAHTVSFHGRFTIAEIIPPRAD